MIYDEGRSRGIAPVAKEGGKINNARPEYFAISSGWLSVHVIQVETIYASLTCSIFMSNMDPDSGS